MRMREILDLIEAADKPMFYHASETELPIGTVLEPRNRNMVDDDIEDILEQYRPKRRLPRSQVVYMVQDLRKLPNLAIKGDYVYRVKPARSVVRLDHTWVNQIWSLLARYENDRPAYINSKITQYAKGYWSGLECLGLPPLWECLTPSAKIIERVK